MIDSAGVSRCRAAITFVAALFLLTLNLMGCSSTGVMPRPPYLGTNGVNATYWKYEPLTVYFSRKAQLAETASTRDLNDLYFGNRYALQVELHYQIGEASFEVRERGVAIPSLSPRANRIGTPPDLRKPRVEPPKNTSSYSVELVSTCRGHIVPSGAPCPDAGAIILLTISPPVQPAAPVHAQVFEYDLVETGYRNYRGQSATTRIRAVYIEPDRCAVRNLKVNPAHGRAGDLATADFQTTDCKRVLLSMGSDTLFDQIATGHAEDMRESRKFVLPKKSTLTVTVKAFDAMNGEKASSSMIEVDPCSISPTHPKCEVDCAKNPKDARCPPDCIAAPTDPRCMTPCARTSDNPKGEYRTWRVGLICGTTRMPDYFIDGCTLAEAIRNHPPSDGCAYTTISGTPVGDCANGNPKQPWEICLTCEDKQGNLTKEYVVVDACTYQEAANSAVKSRQNMTCSATPGFCTGDCPGGYLKQDWNICLTCTDNQGGVTKENMVVNACLYQEATNSAINSRPNMRCSATRGFCP